MIGFGSRLGLAIFAIAALIGTVATLTTPWTLDLLDPFVVTAMLLMVLGEQLTVRIARRSIAPVTSAAALGLILAPVREDGLALTAPTVIALVWVGMLIGSIIARVRGRDVPEGSFAARFLGLTVSAVLLRGVPLSEGGTLLEAAFAPGRAPVGSALILVAVAAVGSVAERLVETLTAWRVARLPWRVIIADEFGTVAGLSAATVTSGPLIALAFPLVGAFALPIFLLPIVLVLVTVRRVAAVKRDQEQAIEAMSRLGEVAALSRIGHTHRVADLSATVARAMGLDEGEVSRVRRTALLHDVGLIGLDNPPVGGTGVLGSAEDRQRIAATEREVIVESGVFDDIATRIAHVRTPFRASRELGHPLPVASRIVRVVSAWDDITEGAQSSRARGIALERLHLGLGYEYDPDVVDILERIKSRS